MWCVHVWQCFSLFCHQKQSLCLIKSCRLLSWKCSSNGRALASHARGSGIDTYPSSPVWSCYCDNISWHQHFPNVHIAVYLQNPLNLSNIFVYDRWLARKPYVNAFRQMSVVLFICNAVSFAVRLCVSVVCCLLCRRSLRYLHCHFTAFTTEWRLKPLGVRHVLELA